MATAPRVRIAFASVALAGATLLGATACAQPETIRSYTPANGANAEVGTTKARGLALVTSGGPALLSGALVSGAGDALTGVSGVSLAPNGDPAGELTATGAKVTLPANQLVSLNEKGVAVSGSGLKPGLNARLTLTFSKSGALVVTVPVVSTDHPDWATVKPPVASSAPSATPSSTPSASAPASSAAPASPTASPSR